MMIGGAFVGAGVGVAATGGVTLVGAGAATGGAGFELPMKSHAATPATARTARTMPRISGARFGAGGFWNVTVVSPCDS